MTRESVRTAPVILDGTRLARERTDMIAARAAAVRERRGRPPRLLLLAFAEPDGNVPHIARKLRACERAGIDPVSVLLPAHTTTDAAVGALEDRLSGSSIDGVFAQFPFPEHIDDDAIAAAIPPALDVDIMTRERIDAYMSDADALPPVTVAAGLLLLEGYGVGVSDRTGIVIAEESPFAQMFRIAFARAGARMEPLLAPDAPDLPARLGRAELVIAAAARPGIISSTQLSDGCVAIDVGYFNPGGRGDIDLSGGVSHLGAIAPVPGGIGPMTVSALLERVVIFAEGT